MISFQVPCELIRTSVSIQTIEINFGMGFLGLFSVLYTRNYLSILLKCVPIIVRLIHLVSCYRELVFKTTFNKKKI